MLVDHCFDPTVMSKRLNFLIIYVLCKLYYIIYINNRVDEIPSFI